MMAANGFTKAEVKQIKEGIEKGKLEIKNNQREAAPTPSQSTSSLADELKKLKELMEAGVITPEEFDQQKRKMLGN